MRKLCLLLTGVLLLVGCASKEQKAMEQKLLENLKAPDTYEFVGFEQTKIETLGDQYRYILQNLPRYIEEDQRQIEFRKDILDITDGKDEADANSLAEAKAKLEKDRTKLEQLTKSRDEHASDTSRVVLTYYTLTYNATNSMGATLRDKCVAAFDANGEMTRIRITEEGRTYFLADDIAIPDYYTKFQ